MSDSELKRQYNFAQDDGEGTQDNPAPMPAPGVSALITMLNTESPSVPSAYAPPPTGVTITMEGSVTDAPGLPSRSIAANDSGDVWDDGQQPRRETEAGVDDVHLGRPEASHGEGGGDGAFAYSPSSPAFFPKLTGSAAAQGGDAEPVKKQPKQPKSGIEATKVAKEVLGLNKKSTKGMTPEQKKQLELEEKWKRLMQEEQRLNELERRIGSSENQVAAGAGEVPNFPPKFLCIKPLVYHDIERAVVPQRQRYVTIAYWLWIATCVLVFVNMPIAIGVSYAPRKPTANPKNTMRRGLNVVLAAVYLVGIPLSFLVWYWHVYTACVTGHLSRHVVALFGLLVALAYSIFMFIGPKSYGACGVSYAIHIGETRYPGVVTPVVFVLLLWIVHAGLLAYCIVMQWIYYRRDTRVRERMRLERSRQNVVGV